MATREPGCALRQLRALFAAGTATGLTDSELLERYTASRAESTEAAKAAETAFAALMDRHGAMVWGVCHRVLGDAQEAEDAFQATFLVLLRKADSVRVNGSLGRWLYGVAHRVALRARSAAERRVFGIGRVPPVPSDDPCGELELRELRNAVGEELDRLPAKYRCPVELCHLQGLTYAQAARQLNWPVATVKSRLTKGRLRLRARLAHRGLAPGAITAALATALTSEAWATAPRALVRSMVRNATACATGKLPAAVNDLTKGVLRMMMWEKLKTVLAGAFVVVGLTASALSEHAPIGEFFAKRAPQAAAQTAQKPINKSAGDRRWVRRLSSEAIIEVIGISSFPSGPDTWWRPDGTPLHPAPCDQTEPNISGDDNTVRMLVVARLARIPNGADHEWTIAEAWGQGVGPAMRDGKPLPGLSAMTALLPANADSCTVRFKVAAGPWKTIQTWGKNPGGVGNRNGPSFIFSDAIATKKGTTISVTHDIQDQPVRLVAIDVDGSELAAQVRSGSGVKDFHQIVVEFDQPPEAIKEFWLQTRPYEQVEIPRIALRRK